MIFVDMKSIMYGYTGKCLKSEQFLKAEHAFPYRDRSFYGLIIKDD